MSFTINTTNANNWKRIKMQYVALAAGAALALSAAIGFDAWERSDSTAPSVPSTPASASVTQTSRVPVLTIYLAGSQEQAEHVRNVDNAAAYDRAEFGAVDPLFTSMILLADSAESEQRARMTIAGTYADAAAFGTFEILTVDMRGR